jgi:hypothetical protein
MTMTFLKKIAPMALTALLLCGVLQGCDNSSTTGAGGNAKATSVDPTAPVQVGGLATRPADAATIYLYRPGDDLRGPPFTRIGPLGSDGRFEVELPPGDYIFVLRQRSDGEESGPVREGDLKSEPMRVTVEPGKPLDFQINAFVKTGNQKETFGPATEMTTVITGKITDAEGNPMEGLRAHAYDHVQMSERPKFVSARTGPDGVYTLQMPKGGTYYLCARDKYGGPPKVGDLYGRYDKGSVEPSGVIISDGQKLDTVDIVVHTVW